MAVFCYSLYMEGHMKKADYSYQVLATEQVFKNALDSKYLASILAACPGSGKTTISHMVINRYIAKFPNARVLVLTEGQNTLKNQYLEELQSANVSINFTFGDFNADTQVRVGIPQSIGDLDWDNIDLLICDEAHRFYLASMVQNIIKSLKPKHQVLMTGSPTEYNLYNKQASFFGKRYGIHYIAAEELLDRGVFSAVNMDTVKYSGRDAVKSITAVLNDAKKKGDNISKMMIACPTIVYAKKVSHYLTQIGRKVSLSTSANDKNDVEINRFKAGETDVLIVVGRGVLGFNDSKITYLADLRSSDNVDTSYQLFARVLRKHPNNITKTYVRVGDNKQVSMLHKIKALMDREIFVGYTGKNLKLIAS